MRALPRRRTCQAQGREGAQLFKYHTASGWCACMISFPRRFAAQIRSSKRRAGLIPICHKAECRSQTVTSAKLVIRTCVLAPSCLLAGSNRMMFDILCWRKRRPRLLRDFHMSCRCHAAKAYCVEVTIWASRTHLRDLLQMKCWVRSCTRIILDVRLRNILLAARALALTDNGAVDSRIEAQIGRSSRGSTTLQP
eukprot:5683651-Pleurochrysis_carterae.AAC.1